MGRDRLADVSRHGAEVLVSSDASCLLHLESLVPSTAPGLRTLYVGELLEEATR